VESVLRPERSLWWERFAKQVGLEFSRNRGRCVPFAVVVDARQRGPELDDVAGRVSHLLGLVVGVMAHELRKRGERLVAEQTETLAVVLDLHVRHRIANPARQTYGYLPGRTASSPHR